MLISIYEKNKKVYEETMPYVTTFSAVEKGKPLVYLNSLLNVSLALNEDNFSEKFKVFSGPDWSITLRRAEK